MGLTLWKGGGFDRERGGRRKSAALVGCLASGNWPSGSQHSSELAAGDKREKTCEKFRQMKTHSVVFVWLPPPPQPHCWACRLWRGQGGGKKGVNEVVKESQRAPSTSHTHMQTQTHTHTQHLETAESKKAQELVKERKMAHTKLSCFSYGWKGGKAFQTIGVSTTLSVCKIKCVSARERAVCA